jgi:hypothetical protein
MDKLTLVHAGLNRNSDVTIVAVLEKHYPLGGQNAWNHTVDFYLAPRMGGIYTVDELQELLLSLLPGVTPTDKDDFRESRQELEFGKLYVDEDISVPRSGQKLRRRIWVRVFPNTEIAADAMCGKHKHSISRQELAEYR